MKFRTFFFAACLISCIGTLLASPTTYNVHNIVFKENIDAKINDLVCDLTHKNGLVKGDLKKHSAQEYESRFQKVKTKLSKIMADHYGSFVYIEEIDTAVYDEFTPFIKRIKAQNKNDTDHSTSESSGGFWDWLFGTNNQTTATTTQPSSIPHNKHKQYGDYDLIYRSELNDKVLEISNQFLEENNYNVETIPARVVSDYSDAIQKIIKQTKDELGNDGYSIYAYKIKNLAKKELMAIIDKIKYKGETCCICLEDIKSQQTLGVLNCGHFFHKKCIQTSLDYNHKCPLCGTYVNKIDHTKTVPS